MGGNVEVRVRLADVARAAGVSKAAVSFAFNQPDRLSAGTASRIRDVATAMGYRPHPVARMLTQPSTLMLGVLTPQELPVVFQNPWFSELAEGIATAAADSGYGIAFISPLGGSLASATRRAIVDGVVCVGLSHDHPEVAQLHLAGLAMVMVDSDLFDGFSSVEADDEAGAELAAEHLLSLGHRDIVVLAVQGPVSPPTRPRSGVPARRLAGYRRAFERSGLTLHEDRVVTGPASIAGGHASFRDAWAAGVRPTGVLAMSDAMALGSLAAARELGLAVPDDLSVVGFDDIAVAALAEPPLSTVHQPIRSKGESAARLLLTTISGGTQASVEHRRVKTRLVIRRSSGPVPARERR